MTNIISKLLTNMEDNQVEKNSSVEANSSKKQPLIWGAIIIILALGVITALMVRDTESDKVLATVDNHPVLENDIKQLVNQMLGQYKEQGVNVEENPELLNEVRKAALASKIRQKILFQYAEQRDVVVNEDSVEDEYQRMVLQFEGGESDLLQGLSQYGITKKDLRKDIFEMLLLQKVANQRDDLTISDQEVQSRYNNIVRDNPETEFPPLSEIKEILVSEMEQEKMGDVLRKLFDQIYPDIEVIILDEDLVEVAEFLGRSSAVPGM